MRPHAADRDASGLHRLRHVAHQVDVQQPVFEARPDRPHVVGETEGALERACGDPAVQEVPLLLVLLVLTARHGERVLARLDGQTGLGEPRHRQRDPVLVLAGLLDVVGRVGRGRLIQPVHGLEEVHHPVEADRAAEQGGCIERFHGSHPPTEQRDVWDPRFAIPLEVRRSRTASAVTLSQMEAAAGDSRDRPRNPALPPPGRRSAARAAAVDGHDGNLPPHGSPSAPCRNGAVPRTVPPVRYSGRGVRPCS